MFFANVIGLYVIFYIKSMKKEPKMMFNSTVQDTKKVMVQGLLFASPPVPIHPQSPDQLAKIEREAIRLSEEIKAEYWAVSAKSGGQTHNMYKHPPPAYHSHHPIMHFIFSLSQVMASGTSSSAWPP